MARRPARPRSQLPSCYYEGYLEKRSFKDKTSRKLWACLCGDALFFFNDKRDTNYVEKLDLRGMKSLTDDSSPDRNLDAARLILVMKDGNIKFTVPTAEARELWKGFILSVLQLSVPSSLNLLPGQIHMLREAVDKERERQKNIDTYTLEDPYVALKPEMPHCFYDVSRLQAELLLEKEAKRGNLLLRPSGGSYALTTRQDLDGSVFKHYRVSRKHEGGFIIDVDNPVFCATLHDVVNYLVEKTEGVLIPLIIEDTYEKKISFIKSDRENGEKNVQHAPPNLVPPNLVPPSVPPKRTALPVALRTTTPEPAPAPAPAAEPAPEPEPITEYDSNIYEIVEKDKEGEEDPSASAPPSQLDKNAPKKAIMPPTPAPRKLTLLTVTPPAAPSASASAKNEPRPRTHSDPLAQTITELKLKLEKKGKE